MKKMCERWLLCIAAAHVVGGLALPFIAYSSTFDFYLVQLGVAFPAAEEAETFQRWIIALFGPTVAGWGVLMIFLVRAGARTQERWPWDALLLSVLAWLPADIAISLMHDFWLHVAVDVVAAVGIVVPALLLRMPKVA